jgi:hypothetical protein
MSLSIRSPFTISQFQTNHADIPASHTLIPRTGKNNGIYIQTIDQENIDGKLNMAKHQPCPVKGLTSYMGRIMVGLIDGDYIFVPEEIYASTRQIHEYIEETGVFYHFPEKFGINGLPRENIIPVPKPEEVNLASAVMEQICGQNQDQALQAIFKNTKSVLPFIYSPEFDQITQNIRERSTVADFRINGNTAASEIINHKGEGMKALEQRSVRIVDGETVYTESRLKQIYRKLKQKGFKKVALKLPRSASGYGIITVETEAELAEALKDPRYTYHLQELTTLRYAGTNYNLLGIRVEGWMDNQTELEKKKIKVVASPGVMITVGRTPEEDEIFSASDQIFEDHKTHMGNMWPLQYWNKEMENAVKAAADWSRELGYFGVLGVDFIMVRQNGEIIPYVVEMNARVTGQTHAAMLMKNLHGSAMREDQTWFADTYIKIPPGMSFDAYTEHLKKTNLEYHPDRGGLIPVTFNSRAGKIQGIFTKPIDPRSSLETIRTSIGEWKEIANIT